MKKTHTILTALATALLTACGGPKEQKAGERTVEATDPETGITDLRELHVQDSVRLGGHTYRYRYDFVPNDSMPVVRNPQGDDYHDNQVTLVVTQGQRTIVSRTFTKHDFSDLMPHDFISASALVGFTYNYTKADATDALYFIATVGDPDETADISFPVQLKITPTGAITHEKATGLDTEPISPGLTIDPSDEGGV